jgi:hypothetical protein
VVRACDAVAAALRGYRFPVAVESDLQLAIEVVLAGADVGAVRREYELGRAHGRIDFYLPNLRCGVELKCDGSPASVRRQLMRYAMSDEIDGLVLVTTRGRLGEQPDTLNGKPVAVVATQEGCF